MKTQITVTTLCLALVLTAYTLGQSQRTKEPECSCCPHTKQIAEDLHWIREKMSKPYVPPPDIGMGQAPQSIEFGPVENVIDTTAPPWNGFDPPPNQRAKNNPNTRNKK